MKNISGKKEIGDMTISDLANIVNESFIYMQENMVTKVEFSSFKSNTETALYELDRHAKVSNERLGGVENRLDALEIKVDAIGMEIMGRA